MPKSRCTTHSVWKPNASLPTVAWPENPPSKYFSSASRTRALMRSRRASPSSMCLPDTRKDMDGPPVAVPNQTPRRVSPTLSQLGTTTEVSMRWFVLIDQAIASLSRRRWTEDGMRMASRYLATVRRAISMPDSRSRSTMVSSDNTSWALSASIRCLMRSRTASAEWASPPSYDAIDEVKKYFNSKMPRLVAVYLLAVTRETVDSCMLIASGKVFRLSGRRNWTPCAKNPSCWRTISVDTLRMVLARWSSARISQ